METFLGVLILISAIVLIATVLVTESEQAGLGSLSGEKSSWGEYRGTSKRDVENRIISIASVVFFISVIAIAAI